MIHPTTSTSTTLHLPSSFILTRFITASSPFNYRPDLAGVTFDTVTMSQTVVHNGLAPVLSDPKSGPATDAPILSLSPSDRAPTSRSSLTAQISNAPIVPSDQSPVDQNAGEPRHSNTSTAPTAPSQPARSLIQTATIMTSLCACVFVAALEVTIVSTALPTISAHFASPSGYTWIGTSVGSSTLPV